MNRVDLKESDLPCGFTPIEGKESKIYKFKDDKLLKLFKMDEGIDTQNKLNKLLILSQLDIKENIFRDLVFVDDVLRGYTVDDLTKKGYKPTFCLEQKRKERLEILKKTLERLEEFHELGIIYGDITESNILYNGSNIIFCDMCNVNIGGYTFDMPNMYQRYYLNTINKIDSSLDNFMFNMHFIAYYLQEYYVYVYAFLNSTQLKGRLANDECKKIVHDILFLDENYNGDLFINHLNDDFKTKLKRALLKR